MPFPYYEGRGQQREAVDLPAPIESLHDPRRYLADTGLRDAANVALLLGRPLLLTGEPGTGKTDFAASLAWELDFDPLLTFETKSTSTARDLFYVYDTLGRFHAAHSGTGPRENREYIRYVALGLAIIRANQRNTVAEVLPEDFEHPGEPKRSVVLIDEVDKAPRDFPNDILNELDRMYFRVPELGNVRLIADPKLRPIVVVTSNSEKHLPDAFLRRCVYYDLPFPDAVRLRQIVEHRLGELVGGSSPLLSDALEFFHQWLRTPTSGLRKKPSTAELLDWLIALRGAGADTDTFLHHNPTLAATTLSALVKGEDQQSGLTALRAWVTSKAGAAPDDVRPVLEKWLQTTAR